MATVIKNNNKKGVTYRIQVAAQARDGRKTHITTWTPPPGLTEAQGEAAAKKYAIEFERQIKEQNKNRIELPVTIKVNDLIPHYLEFIKKHSKLTHYVGTKRRLIPTQKELGHYRVMDLTPYIIQDFIDNLDEATYSVTTATPTQLAEVMKEQGIGTYTLARTVGCSCTTTKNAVSGKNIDVSIAKRIAKVLKVDAGQIFDITTEEVPYAYATKNGAITSLSGLLSFAVRNMIITDNYAEDKYVTKFQNVISEDDSVKYMEDYHIAEFLSKLRFETDIRMKVNAYLTIMMGYRRGEVAGLEWQDIDLERGKIKIRRASLTIAGVGVVEETPKSRTSIREGYLPNQLTELLKEYKVWWDEFVAKLGDKAEGCQRLFLQANGKPIFPSTLYHWLQKQEKRFGLPVVSMHSIRKTCLSMQKQSGLIDIDSIVRDAGHSDSRVTKEHYIKTFDSEKKKVAEAKEAIFRII